MLSHLKEIAQIGSQLARLNDHVLTYGKEIETLKKELNETKNAALDTKETLMALQSQEKELAAQVKEEIISIKEASTQLRKAVYDFTVLKKDMQKEIMARFESQLKEEILVQGKELRHATQDYTELRNQLNVTQQEVTKASAELSRFSQVIKGIKETDTKLTQFSQQVEAHSREKLELQRKIDSLERLVSKMRRK